MEQKPKPTSEIVFYQTEDGRTRLEVKLENETVWLTQAQMAELFQTTPQNMTLHLQAIYEEGELNETATCKDYLQVRAEGARQVQRALKHYNLDAIISVGYRVKSRVATQFRIWATQRLREYIVKGFTLDDERLKQGGGAYFDELLARIREIRASEKNFYQKIRDIYATSVDYDLAAEITQDFFAIAQNKLHWAIHGHTAAEVIAGRANASKPNMGLMAWSGSKVRKHDVHVAKNYLAEEEMGLLNLIVTQYLDFAEFQARTRKAMSMRDWAKKLDDFLRVNDREILQGFGKVSAQLAKEKADREFGKFQKQQQQIEDAKSAEEFAAEVKALEEKTKQIAPPTRKGKK
jgi:hypothetical protein